MKTVITYKGLKVEITIDDAANKGHQVGEHVKPPNYPGVKFPMSLKDKRKMDEQVEAANQILKEEK